MPPKDPPNNNHLLALGTAAVLAVFGAGFVRTQQAAERLESSSRRRQPAAPVVAPKNAADVSTSAPTASLTKDVAPAESAKSVETVATTQTSGVKTEPAAKARVDEHPETTATTAVAVTPPIIRPTPATADSAPAKSAIDSSIVSVARDLKDGVYTGWGYSRHGDIESRVEIRNGRIISASIAQCLTMYSVYWIAALPPQVVKRQSPEVDVISGATESSNAFYDGIVLALKKAQ